MAIPFWKQPLVTPSQNGSSENESSVGSRVNIQQKLQEKKQKQLAELKVIEEEIKQGKLVGPHNKTGTLSSNEDARRQPIPRSKKHDLDTAKFYDSVSGYSNLVALQGCYTDASDVDAVSYGAAYHHHHHQHQTPPPPTNNLSARVIPQSKVPRTFHQNIQTSLSSAAGLSQPPEAIITTTNQSSKSSRSGQARGALHLSPGNFVAGVYTGASPSVHAYSNRGTPIQSPMMHILHMQQQQQQPQPQVPYPEEFYEAAWTRGGGGGTLSSEEEEDNTHHPPSDIDSQMSRSYTLPREFKYNRRKKGGHRKMDNFVAGNNSSSDGDVDSGDDNESPANVSASRHYHHHHPHHQNNQHMTRRQQAAAGRNPPMATGRISVPAVGNQPIYLNAPQTYVRNLDLISNVLDGTVVGQQLTSPSRRLRYPGFRGGGIGQHEVRHETKL